MQIHGVQALVRVVWYAYLPVSCLGSPCVTALTKSISPVKTTMKAGFVFDQMLIAAMHCINSNESFGAHDLGMHIVSLCALSSDQIIPAHAASGDYSGAATRPESIRFMRQEYASNRLAWRSPSTAITLCSPIMRIITDEGML